MAATNPQPNDVPDIEWDHLAPESEISATVIMASGFALQAGQKVVERYRVVRVLGEGSMGQVLAVTLAGSTDQQTYALKVVARPSLDFDPTTGGTAVLERVREAEQAAKSFAALLRAEAAKQEVAARNGVGVARLFALVQLDDGSIGMRMEAARGRSLESMVYDEIGRRDQSPDILLAASITRKLLSQLRRLHEIVEAGSPLGFIHSDIKPGNVFVDDADSTDVQVTLLDFGVATAGQLIASDLALRHDGRKTFILQQIGGTIGYAPPHHFSSKATPLSDVYAAIVCMYELITLQCPWQYGSIPQSPDNIPQLEKVMKEGPKAVRAVRPSIAPGDAAVLDEFFASEFTALHQLAETTSSAWNSDDAKRQADATRKLRLLAREYQSKIDRLTAAFRPGYAPAERSYVGPPPQAPQQPPKVVSPVVPRPNAGAKVGEGANASVQKSPNQEATKAKVSLPKTPSANTSASKQPVKPQVGLRNSPFSGANLAKPPGPEKNEKNQENKEVASKAEPEVDILEAPSETANSSSKPAIGTGKQATTPKQDQSKTASLANKKASEQAVLPDVEIEDDAEGEEKDGENSKGPFLPDSTGALPLLRIVSTGKVTGSNLPASNVEIPNKDGQETKRPTLQLAASIPPPPDESARHSPILTKAPQSTGLSSTSFSRSSSVGPWSSTENSQVDYSSSSLDADDGGHGKRSGSWLRWGFLAAGAIVCAVVGALVVNAFLDRNRVTATQNPNSVPQNLVRQPEIHAENHMRIFPDVTSAELPLSDAAAGLSSTLDGSSEGVPVENLPAGTLGQTPLDAEPSLPHVRHSHHSSRSSPGHQNCSCVSDVMGARVVAHGGSLRRDIVLCVANHSLVQGRNEAHGTGNIPESVLTSGAEISCRAGSTTLQVSSSRYQSGGGTTTMFHCRPR